MKKIKLFCLPYAGGSATVYNKWKDFLSDSIELHPVELAGRGKRFNQRFYNSIHEALDDILKSICHKLDDSNYAVFGHSMGNLLAFELVYELEKLGYQSPVHIFFSGRCPPHIARKNENLHLLPDEEFKERILSIGGTPKEVFASKELCDIFIPVLKADYKIVETYTYSQTFYKYDCDISALSGIDDTGTPYSQMLEWKIHTQKSCKNYQFDGGHFFIHSQMEEVIRVVNETLLCK